MARKKREGANPEMAFAYRAYLCSGEKAFLDEMYGRIRLWNKLVEIDTAYRDQVRELTGQAPRKDAIKEHPEIEARLDLMDVARRNAVHDACAASGLHDVNHGDVRDNYQAAARKHPSPWEWWKDKDTDEWHCEPWNLNFHSFRPGNGKILIRAQRTPRRLHYGETLSDGRHTPEQTVTLEVGLARAPVTVEVRMHRPLPDDAHVQRVELHRDVDGYHESWHLVYVVETGHAEAPTRIGARSVAVDLGWSVHGDGLRVARWEGNDGLSGDVILPGDMIRGFDRVDDLASIRKKHFLSEKDQLIEWLSGGESAPDPLREKCATLAQWESPYRLCALMDAWHRQDPEKEFAGWPVEGETALLLQGWARREHHLANEQTNLRRRLLARREHLYGCVAAQLCRDYDEIVMDDIDLGKLARRTPGETKWDDARRNRVRAAVSELRLRILSTARREGVRIVEPVRANSSGPHGDAAHSHATTTQEVAVA